MPGVPGCPITRLPGLPGLQGYCLDIACLNRALVAGFKAF